jgi:hypothetical protein
MQKLGAGLQRVGERLAVSCFDLMLASVHTRPVSHSLFDRREPGQALFPRDFIMSNRHLFCCDKTGLKRESANNVAGLGL